MIDKKIQADRAAEENRIQKAPISPEIYPVRSLVVGQNR